jgi:hypothetical protein
MLLPYQLNHLEINVIIIYIYIFDNYLQRKSARRPTLSTIKTNNIATAKYVIPHEIIAYDVYSIFKCARKSIKSPK